MVRKNLKVPESLFSALKDDKPDHQSWPAYLEEQCLSETDVSQDGSLGYDDVRQACAKAINQELPDHIWRER